MFLLLLPKARSAGESDSYYCILSLEGKKILTSEELAWYSDGSELVGGSVVTFAGFFQLEISNRNVLRHCHAFAVNPVFLQIITCGSWIIHLYKADWILSGCFTSTCSLPKQSDSFKIIHQILSEKTTWAQPLKKNQSKEIFWFLALSTPLKPTPCILPHNILMVKDAN